MKVRIINRSTNPLPAYQTSGSAGVDLRAFLDEAITLEPLERRLIPTGLHIALPNGYEAQLRARSGLSTKHGITLINAVGTIDSDYRGEIKVGLVNLSREAYTIEPGDRIAQMIIAQYEQVNFQLVDELDTTERGEGGFGSTDKK
ncbi:MAG TPA: dUTP diphosphatase [Tissierellia bacterium]|nr:dUTP diphosphatase [Tissierellia bacterium]